jgi:hypothetical protein
MIAELSKEQLELWGRVVELWSLSQARDRQAIESALHPDYTGWDMSTEEPHDREAAVHSVLGDSPQLADYVLQPRSVQVYDHRVGVVHYAYSATVAPHSSEQITVTGKWTEVYLRQNDVWLMIAVSGRPDTRQTS